MSKLIKQFSKTEGSNSIRIELQRVSNVLKQSEFPEGMSPEQTISEAREEARRILEEAERQVEDRLSKVEAEIDERFRALSEKEQSIENQMEVAREEGRKVGFQEGYETGKSRAESDYSEKIEQSILILSKAKAQYKEKLQEAEPDLIKLSIGIARKIVGTALVLDETYENYVSQALKQVKGEEDVKLFTAPDRYEQVQSTVKKLGSIFNVDIMVYPDEAMSSDQCLIETKYGQIDASVDSQLSQLEEKLLELAGERDEYSTTTDSAG